MANQPETPVYDADVYQIETNDPVQGGAGGVNNRPLLNLANRTAYLKQHLDGLENGTTIPPTVAPKNSPGLTGNPTAPTAPLSDNDTSIATTAFVKGVAKGRLAKSVAGGVSVSLSADDAAYAILDFSGALTASIAVIVPAAPYLWTVRNGTTGAHTLTVKTASGTGVTITQGASAELWCDGTNVFLSTTDFVSPTLTGTPTAPTQPLGDSSIKIATTAFVAAALAAQQTGQVAFFAGMTPPAGWLKANGAAVSRSAYAALFSVIGTAFGSGDGSATFNLPDLRGEFLRGWDDARGVDSGRGFGTLQGQQIQSHLHTFPSDVNVWIDGPGAFIVNASGNQVSMNRMPQTASTGGAETRPRNVALLACIKY